MMESDCLSIMENEAEEQLALIAETRARLADRQDEDAHECAERQVVPPRRYQAIGQAGASLGDQGELLLRFVFHDGKTIRFHHGKSRLGAVRREQPTSTWCCAGGRSRVRGQD